MSSGSPPQSPAKAAPRLRPAKLDDYPQIERLESAHGLLPLPAQTWRGLWLDNPLRQRLGDAWPIGWVLEDAKCRVVGSLTNVPTLFMFQGRPLIAATGRAWVVAPECRGVALWLMDEYFRQKEVDLFINTTVNGLAVDPFRTFGSSRVPLGDWETGAYWVTGYRGFAASALRIKGVPLPGLLSYPSGAALWVKDAASIPALPTPPGWAMTGEARTFDARFDVFWDELVRQRPDKLLGARDGQTLRWHFAGPLRAGRAWIFTVTRSDRLRAYCVLKRQDHPGSGLVRMRLVDYQSLESGDDLLPALLRIALGRCHAEGVHVLEHVGCGLPKMRCLDRFAPRRRKLPAWSFYYHAVDPAIDCALKNPEAWDPSAFDGDASL